MTCVYLRDGKCIATCDALCQKLKYQCIVDETCSTIIMRNPYERKITSSPELTVFPTMSGKEFIEFLMRAQEEYKKSNTLSENFINKELGETGSIEEGAKKLIKRMIEGDHEPS